VVGAGLGGLSAAAHLRAEGFEVTVIERASRPGGCAGLIETEGFRFDTGPTVLTMPELVDQVFAAIGFALDDVCPVRRVDPMYRGVFADGSELRVWADRQRMTDEIGSLCGRADAAGFAELCRWLERLYRVEMPHYIDRNYGSGLDLIRPLRAAVALVRLGGLGRLDHVVAKHVTDERLLRMLTFQSMYAGLAPFEALALYAVITYMDCVRGVFVPQGGMHQIAAQLTAALEKAGVTVHLDTEVRRILRDQHGRAAGADVGADRSRIAADAVVCNLAHPSAYRELLDGAVPVPRRVRRTRYAPSCVRWLAGARGHPPAGAAHHNVHFGRAWDGAFRDVIERGTRMADPSILVSIPSRNDETVAPAGTSSLCVLEPVPNLQGNVDWAKDRSRVADDLRRRVADHGYPSDTITEHWTDPDGWAREGMEQGTPFAAAHTLRQTGPFRARNVERRVPGLAFAGSFTVPGVGIPMVLLSGKLAAQRIVDSFRTRR
jgi:phytoene desaturase